MDVIDLKEMMFGDDVFPSPAMYQYYKNMKNNTIVINSDIDDSILETAILPLMQMDADPEVKEIKVIILTCGGDIYSGFAFVSALERCTTPITIQLVGIAASMGTLIAMAKSPYITVVCDSFTVGLIHSGSTYLEGNVNSVKDTFKFSEKYEKKIKDYMLSHTKIDEDLYDKIERQEYWIDADEMLELGIVDKII